MNKEIEEWIETRLDQIPSHLIHGIIRKVLFGTPCGSFLESVFIGDLHMAVVKADSVCLRMIPEIYLCVRDFPGGTMCSQRAGQQAPKEWTLDDESREALTKRLFR